MRGTGSSRYIADNLFVPEGRAISLSSPPRANAGRGYRVPVIGTAHLAFASQALGAARGALEDLIALASGKTAAFSNNSLREEETTQTAIGQCRARLSAALAHRDWAITQLWDAAADGAPTPEMRADARLAAIAGVDAAINIIDTVYRISGTTGIFAGTALHRRFQDVHVLAQQVVGRPKHYQNVGRLLLGLEYDDLFL
jgi:alkylation response protein AidB-like acyl-CoA dehydrogenase